MKNISSSVYKIDIFSSNFSGKDRIRPSVTFLIGSKYHQLLLEATIDNKTLF